MMTGSSVCEWVSRSRVSTSRPLMPGISTSSSTRSYRSVDAHFSASSPLAAFDDKAFLDETARERVAVELGIVDDEKRARPVHDIGHRSAEQRLDFSEQRLKANRLRVEVVAAGRERHVAIAGHRMRAQAR